MKLIKAFAIGAVLAAGAAFAQDAEPTDPNAMARSELMKTVGKNTGILGDMAGGKATYDAAAAEGAKAALIDAAAKIEATFMDQGAADPASEAKPEIWANWDDFLADAKALGDAAAAMDVASAETIGAGMGALGGACKDCHTEFRVMKQ
jgi:cytochrome c556